MTMGIGVAPRPNRIGRKRLSAASLLCLAGALSLSPTARASDDGWQFAVSPYVWLPTIDMDLRYDLPPGQGTSADVSVGPSDLEGAFLIAGEARKGDWSIMADMVYMDLKIDSRITRVNGGNAGEVRVPRSLDAGTTVEFEGGMAQLAAGLTLARTPSGSNFDVLAGARYLTVSTRLDWDIEGEITGTDFSFARSGRAKADIDSLDFILGGRGRVQLSERWFAPYYFDLGLGDADLTWQAMAGIGYRWNQIDATLAWRVLDYEESDSLLSNANFSGPLLGVTFRF